MCFRYKFFFGFGLGVIFMNIGDGSGLGVDYCEFVGGFEVNVFDVGNYVSFLLVDGMYMYIFE